LGRRCNEVEACRLRASIVREIESEPAMYSVDLESSVTDWLIEHPGLLSLFQELGIDYSVEESH
jgi:hypothetical protein